MTHDKMNNNMNDNSHADAVNIINPEPALAAAAQSEDCLLYTSPSPRD